MRPKTEKQETLSSVKNQPSVSNNTLILENNQIGIALNRKTGALAELRNKLSGACYRVENDAFQIQTHETLAMSSFQLDTITRNNDRLTFRYKHFSMIVEVAYRLYHHFLRKLLSISPAEDCIIKRVVVSAPTFSSDQLICVTEYRYQMNKTFFGRTPQGGFFTGLELPFDNAGADDARVTLAFSPNCRLRKREKLACEAAYFGVYRRMEDMTARSYAWGELRHGDYHPLPLPEESAAMVAMTSIVLGPSRHGSTAVFASSMASNRNWNTWYRSHSEVENNKKVLDFARECGFDWVHDFMPWSGEAKKVNTLKGRDVFKLHAWSRELRDYAKHLGLKPILWSTMTNSQPWSGQGQPFRSDRPDWLIKPVRKDTQSDVTDMVSLANGGNCMGSKEFVDWLERHFRSTLNQGFQGFSLDGDFYGTGGWYTTTGTPIQCLAGNHAHAPGNAQYVCTRALLRFFQNIRRQYPDALLWLMRPMMDLGVWTCKGGDAIFPIDECASRENLTGIENQPGNVLFGDKVRIWSRIRVHYHFMPHYLDQVYLFPGVNGAGLVSQSWQSEHLDYLMLSAISSAPNQCYFTGPYDRVPAEDRKTIKKWLHWARKNEKYLMVRKDLPVWPKKHAADGSAHIVAGRGYIFLFNPNKEMKQAEFRLTTDGTGISEKRRYTIRRIYPAKDSSIIASYGDTITCKLEGYTAAILEIHKTKKCSLSPFVTNRTMRRIKTIEGWDATGLLPPVSKIAGATRPSKEINFERLENNSRGYALVLERHRGK